MTHYIQTYFARAFHKLNTIDLRMNQWAGGWRGVMFCHKTGNYYEMFIKQIKTETKVVKSPEEVLTVNAVLKKGGFYDSVT